MHHSKLEIPGFLLQKEGKGQAAYYKQQFIASHF